MNFSFVCIFIHIFQCARTQRATECGWIAPECVTGFRTSKLKQCSQLVHIVHQTTGSGALSTRPKPHGWREARRRRKKSLPLNIIQYVDVRNLHSMQHCHRGCTEECEPKKMLTMMNTGDATKWNKKTTKQTNRWRAATTATEQKKNWCSQRQYRCFYIREHSNAHTIREIYAIKCAAGWTFYWIEFQMISSHAIVGQTDERASRQTNGANGALGADNENET